MSEREQLVDPGRGASVGSYGLEQQINTVVGCPYREEGQSSKESAVYVSGMDSAQKTAQLEAIDINLGESETGFNGKADLTMARNEDSVDSSYTRVQTVPSDAFKKDSISKPNHNNLRSLFCIVSLAFIIGLTVGLLIGVFGVNRCYNEQANIHCESESQTGQLEPNPTQISVSTTNRATRSTNNPNINTTQFVCPPYSTTSGSCELCPKPNPVTPGDDATTTSLFAPLTQNEIQKAKRFLAANGFSGTSYLKLTHIYLYPPEKSKALSYLDDGGPFPGRYATVHVTRTNRTPPDVMEYKIGPLHADTAEMTYEKLVNDGEIHYNSRPYSSRDYWDALNVVKPHTVAMKTLLSDSFDGIYVGKSVSHLMSGMHSPSTDDRAVTTYLYYSGESGLSTIRVLPVQCIVHFPGIDKSKWFASDFYYLNQGPYSSGEELNAAYLNGSLSKTMALPKGYWAEHIHEYSLQQNLSEQARSGSDIPPPRTYEPQGPRYSVKGQKVNWMDWSFEFSADPIRGPAVFDIRFKNKRIAYEISLQDITLIYASGTTGAGMAPARLSDIEFMLGKFKGFRRGLDCPLRANTLQSTQPNIGTPIPAACIYEADGQEPLWRHYRSGSTYGLVNNYLVVRAPMVLGNYDYSVQWKFYLDGHVETTVTASGYLFLSFWDSEHPVYGNSTNTPFGFRIGDLAVGSIHDHSFLFKVDIDVYGRNNSFEVIHWKGGDVVTALNTQGNVSEEPPYFVFDKTRYLQYETVTREKGFIFNTLKPQVWTIVNEKERNEWGVKRGYSITPMSAGADVLPADHPYMAPWSHMKYNCAVTKYNAREIHGTASLYDLRNPNNWRGGIDKMLDDDVIQNEDLVAWVTAKFMHVPTSEDLPMTMNVEKGFVLKPYNYFDRSSTFDIAGHYSYSEPYSIQKCYENM